MIKAVLFDLDGTLLDRETSLLIFAENQFNRYFSDHKTLDKNAYVQRFIDLDARGKVWKDKVYQDLVSHFSITALGWETLLEDYCSQFKNHCHPFPFLHETLQTLKSRNCSLGLITNGRTSFQMTVLNAMEITPYFSSILISEQENLRKPDKEIFLRALQQLNIKAEEAIFIGDDPIADIKGAQQAGIKAIWKKTGYTECDFADDQINCLSEIPKKLL